MKQLLRSVFLPVLAFLLSTSALRAQEYVALLTGHQEVPSTTTLASATVRFELTSGGDSLSLEGEVENLSSPTTGAHIHLGYAGSNGPVELPLSLTTITGNTNFTDTTYFVGDLPNLAQAMDEGRAYVNLHTVFWPNGEVRGQIIRARPEIEEVYDAMLYGEQENPPVLTDGMGGVIIETSTDSVYISGSFSLDSPLFPAGQTGAHLHTGLVGENGPILLALTPTLRPGSTTDGVFERSVNAFLLPADFETSIAERQVYVNVHSSAHPTGEVRGQVVPYGSDLYFAYVSNDEPNTRFNADAVMRLMIERNATEPTELWYSGSYQNWNPTVIDADADPFFIIQDPFDLTGQNVVQFPAADVRTSPGNGQIPATRVTGVPTTAGTGLLQRTFSSAGFAKLEGSTLTIFNEEYLYHECKRLFGAPMTASQTMPNARSIGYGDINIEYYTDRIEVMGTFTGLSDSVSTELNGGLHIHDGMVGRSGGIIKPLNVVNITNLQGDPEAYVFAPQNIRTLSSAEAQAMRDRGYYLNVHTPTFPSGELRGQVVPRAHTYLHAPIANGQTVPNAPASAALGAAFLELTNDQVVLTGTFDNVGGFDPTIGGTGVHLHGSLAGRAGGILQDLVSLAAPGATSGELFAEDNTFTVDAANLDSLYTLGAYVNLHTTASPSGELRGQVGPLANAVLHARLSPEVTKPYTGTFGEDTGSGDLHGLLFGTTAVLSGSFNGLRSTIDTSIMGGAHLHRGTAGTTGNIVLPLNLDLDAGDSTAQVRAIRNAFSNVQSQSIMGGGGYINVHTTGAPTGAIRGQFLLSTNQHPTATSTFVSPLDGATVDLNSDSLQALAVIEWLEASDPDVEQDLAYIWQLFVDTLAAPVFYGAQDSANQLAFTFAQLDTLLNDLGVAEGESATVFHRVVATDGSLLATGEFADVTFTRILVSGLDELPSGSAHLLSNLLPAGAPLTLAVQNLPAGALTYRLVSLQGETLGQGTFNHAGTAQQYELLQAPATSGMYGLQLLDASGRSTTWMLVVR